MGSFTAIAETKKQLPKGTEPIPLYTHPHQWQGLTDDEINELADFWDLSDINIEPFIEKVERKVKEKNYG
jgi:hypothetical protein